jgi:D-alanine-D-alanine ligase
MLIEIVTTPNSDLKETGFGSVVSCKHVLSSLRSAGHSASLSICSNQYELEKIIKKEPDLVILGVKYILIKNDEKIWLSEFFGSKGINYTGSHRETLQFDSNKESAKSYLNKRHIKTSRYFMALPDEYKTKSELPLSFPLFLKPVDAANGNGVDEFSYAANFVAFKNKVLSLYNLYRQPILVEEYLSGREFTVAIIENSNHDLIVSAIEIIPPKSRNGLRILGAKAKNDNTEVLVKITDLDLIKKVKKIASEVFKKLGVRDFGRIDIKLNEKNECYFMEANLVPGMTADTSYFPRAYSLDLGMTYDQVINLLIGQGIRRAQNS